jgi:hypothetical protein
VRKLSILVLQKLKEELVSPKIGQKYRKRNKKHPKRVKPNFKIKIIRKY